MGTLVSFTVFREEQENRDRIRALDEARRRWDFLGWNEYGLSAIGAAQTKFYELFFAGADRQGYFNAKTTPKEQSEAYRMCFDKTEESRRLFEENQKK